MYFSKKKVIFIFVLGCFYNCNGSLKKPEDFFEITLISAECSDAAVKLVQNKHTEKFVLKQIISPKRDEQFLLARDLVASKIGIICNIPINEVFIMPIEDVNQKNSYDIRFYPNRAATIHKLAGGNSLCEFLPNFLNETFDIQQKTFNPDSPWQKKWPVKNNEQGLTKNVIISMSYHNELPKIVAFDTFVGNSDRSLPNIFYDNLKNCFCGIDHSAAFNNYNLPLLAIKQLEDLWKKGFFENCNKQLKKGLKIYSQTLESLCEKISSEDVEKLFQAYACHIFTGHNKWWLEERIKRHANAFKENRSTTRKLISLLQKILYP